MADHAAKQCPQCAMELPPDAPGGLCPRCLMAMNLEPETEMPAEADKRVPSIEELAPHFPHLEMLGCLGRGGMGVVYKARQPELDREVALKILAPELVTDARFAQRFRREAKTLAALNHPNIVTVHDFGEAGGYYYLLMEYVDGVNLRQLQAGQRLSPREALAIVSPICDALQYAHEHDVVHRDIKPENVLLDQEGRVKIADFGIARIVGPAEAAGGGESGSGKTRAGTPGYMAPEQERAEAVDHRADIYSLGVVLYEMLTGELPQDKLDLPCRRLEIDVRLDSVVLRALEQQPERRYQTAAEFKTMVQTVTPLEFPGAQPPPATAKPEGGPARLSRLAVAGAACSLVTPLIAVPAVGALRGGGGLPYWLILLSLMLTAYGMVATTALGWVAVVRVRRSEGPLYGHVRRCGYSPHDAQDITQGFFCRLLEKGWLQAADRQKGRLRSFLIVALKHYMCNQWRRNAAECRGGGLTHISVDGELAESRFAADTSAAGSAELAYDRQWAFALLEITLERLRKQYTDAGKPEEFDLLKSCLMTERGRIDYAGLAIRLAKREGAVRVAVHRLRKRFRQLYREEVAQTLPDGTDIAEEMRHLARAIAAGTGN